MGYLTKKLILIKSNTFKHFKIFKLILLCFLIDFNTVYIVDFKVELSKNHNKNK